VPFTPAAYARVNPLMGTGNYSSTSNNMKLVHWPLMGGLLHLVQRGEDWAGPVPFTALMYSGPLLCAFNVPVKGLMMRAASCKS